MGANMATLGIWHMEEIINDFEDYEDKTLIEHSAT